MIAIKNIYKNAPDSIPVPDEFISKDIEVIFLPVEKKQDTTDIIRFYGAIPDFPDRDEQGKLPEREQF